MNTTVEKPWHNDQWLAQRILILRSPPMEPVKIDCMELADILEELFDFRRGNKIVQNREPVRNSTKLQVQLLDSSMMVNSLPRWVCELFLNAAEALMDRQTVTDEMVIKACLAHSPGHATISQHEIIFMRAALEAVMSGVGKN